MNHTLTIHLLGNPTINRGDVPVSGFHSRKEQALLYYLLVTGKPHARLFLAGLFWGNLSDKRALGNLRRVLTHLRSIVGKHLTITRQTVAFNRESDYLLDVEIFEKQMRAKASLGLPALQVAMNLYRGDFLDGFYVKDCPAFEEWVSGERERLYGLAVEALQSLVSMHRERGEYSLAIAYAHRLLSLSPWLEEIHRELMWLLAVTGRRSEALTQYKTCRRLLKAELGLEPAKETINLYRQLINWENGRLKNQKIDIPNYRNADHLPFVGRGEAHATLVGWWEEAKRGSGKLTLIEGEVGVGKTRIMDEIIYYTKAQGASVLRGRCYEFGSAVPYQPVVEALRKYFYDKRTKQQPTLSPVWLAELSRLMPELQNAHPDLPAPMSTTDDTARQRLFEAVARYLLAIPKTTALLFFLDDLQWADQSTLDLLHYLVRRLFDAPIWIVGTYRSGEVDLDHPLIRLWHGLSRDTLVHHLMLEPLSPTAVREIAQSLVGAEKSVSLGDFLYRESEGNPFILVETINSLQEKGALSNYERWNNQTAIKTVPTGVQNVILQRVGRMSKPARQLLTLAAVIGRRFNLSLLQSASGSDASTVNASLDEWLLHHLVKQETGITVKTEPKNHHRISASNASQYDFSHDKIRAVLYHTTETEIRRTLHRQVGRALERLYAEHLEEIYEQLAYHYEQAGTTEQALVYLTLAAAKATAVYAHQEALDYYNRAMALLKEHDAQYRKILLQRGKVLRLLNRYDEAITACHQVVEVSLGEKDEPLLAAQAAHELSAIYLARRDYDTARIWNEKARRLAEKKTEKARTREIQGEIERERGNLARAQKLFEEALALYREMADKRGMAECLDGLGRVFSAWGYYDVARQYLEEALATYQALDSRQDEAFCLSSIGITYWRQGTNDVAHAAFTDSMKICRTIGDKKGEADNYKNLGLIYIVQGDYKKTQRCWEESVALYRILGLEKQAANALHNLGIMNIDLGNYVAARQYLEESLAISRVTGASLDEALDLGWLGKLYLRCGNYDVAYRYLEEALALDEKVGGTEEEVWHYIWLGVATYEKGDLQSAKDLLQKTLRRATKPKSNLHLREAYQWLVPIYLALGDGEMALIAAQHALAETKNIKKTVERGTSFALLGVVHGSGLLAMPEPPLPYFERALNLLAESSPPDVYGFERGVILRRYGAYLFYNGNREQGEVHLQIARSIFERIGAQGELKKVIRLLNGDDAVRLL